MSGRLPDIDKREEWTVDDCKKIIMQLLRDIASLQRALGERNEKKLGDRLAEHKMFLHALAAGLCGDMEEIVPLLLDSVRAYSVNHDDVLALLHPDEMRSSVYERWRVSQEGELQCSVCGEWPEDCQCKQTEHTMRNCK